MPRRFATSTGTQFAQPLHLGFPAVLISSESCRPHGEINAPSANEREKLMPPYFEFGLFLVAALVQVMALASVAFARLSERCPAECVCRRLFCLFLLLVGSSALAAVMLGSGYWLSFSATLATMAVGGTLDLRHANAGS